MHRSLPALTFTLFTAALSAAEAPRIEIVCNGYEYGITRLTFQENKLRAARTPWLPRDARTEHTETAVAAEDAAKLQTLVESLLTEFRGVKFADNHCEDCLRYEIRVVIGGRVRELRMNEGQLRDAKVKSRVHEVLRTANELAPSSPLPKTATSE